MRHLSGTGAGSGIAIGVARPLPPRAHVEERHIPSAAIRAELGRLETAVASTDAAMAQVVQGSSAPSDVGAALVDTHRLILKSDEIVGMAKRLIRERRIGAEWAVRVVLERMRSLFAQIEDERFRARLEDVEAVADRLVRSLLNLPQDPMDERVRGTIGIGFELSALDVLHLHRMGIAGFATERGGPTAHESIIARSLGIPYVFGVKGLVDLVRSGEIVCVDAAHGEVVVSPDEATMQALGERLSMEADRPHGIQAAYGDPAITLDGTAVSLGANIKSACEVAAALAAGADHIGLVRTELLYLDRSALPSEQEQLQDAADIVRAAGGLPVTFRTLDIGGDKLPAGVRLAVGSNPALGLRGVRLSLRRPELFRTQLRALYRAAAFGPLRIMFPLVSSVSEFREARSVCTQVCAELAAAGIAHDPHTPLGVMIETPSAVLTADHLAAESDFMSVGTNDLIQYTFAADRQNEDMIYLYQPLHPSILRALQQVFAAAERMRRPVSVCGDMAGDPANVWALLGLGLRAFSMATRELPYVKSLLRQTALASAERFAREALLLTCTEDVEALARERMGEYLPPGRAALAQLQDSARRAR